MMYRDKCRSRTIWGENFQDRSIIYTLDVPREEENFHLTKGGGTSDHMEPSYQINKL